ncbi:hypothetical protein H072_39 [Dactylellina haptotyla CBS 200.50]|uniref:Uncharacterized protein n=1 Tax=Dactylellina haptotyla (strain CBS 200.50) TaxID=1284197 RepID=S8C2P1_DACHA|nr:hypothetical protein H072_39 [Dactylellina haptotyla CBS 200.50]
MPSRFLKTLSFPILISLYPQISSQFLIGVYDVTRLSALSPGESPVPTWLLCHPKSEAMFGIYAAELPAGCDSDNDGVEADKWTLMVPGNRHLDIGETISQIYLRGSTAHLHKTENRIPAITYNSDYKNSYFSYGYTGLAKGFQNAPFKLIRDGKPTALSDSNGVHHGDMLDFVGVAGTHMKDRVLRLQCAGENTGHWHVGRGTTLPITPLIPEVEFRVIMDIKKPVPVVQTLVKAKEVSEGFFSAVKKSFNKAGEKMSSGVKQWISSPVEEAKEDEYIEKVRVGPKDVKFDKFEAETTGETDELIFRKCDGKMELAMKAVILNLYISQALGLIISAVPKGPNSINIPNQRLCMPHPRGWQIELIKEGNDPGLLLVDPRDRNCPAFSGPGWYWDIGPNRKTAEQHTLIQLTGGPDTEEQPGVTHSLDPLARLHFGVLDPGKIYRSEFRVKRNGVYQNFETNRPQDASIKVGDILEFWGPSPPGERQLYLQSLFNYEVQTQIFTLVRETTARFTWGPQPTTELHVVDLGFQEVALPYWSNEEHEIKENIRLIDERTKFEKGKSGPGFCGLGGICSAAARGISRIFGGKRKDGPRIEIPGLNSDSSPVDASIDPFSSHRHLRPDSRPESRENSMFTPRESELDIEYGAEDLFEPRVPEQQQKFSLFKPTRLRADEIADILQKITENPEKEEESTIYTEEKEGDELEDIMVGVGDDIPDELVVPEAEFGIGNLQTPQFGEQVDQQPSSLRAEESGDNIDIPIIKSSRTPEIVSPDIQLDARETFRRRIADRRYTTYVRCVQALLRREDGEADEEIQNLVDHDWGLYSPMDFEEALASRSPLPQCPKSRQDIVNLAIDQGHPRYFPPGATGANPQSGVGYT